MRNILWKQFIFQLVLWVRVREMTYSMLLLNAHTLFLFSRNIIGNVDRRWFPKWYRVLRISSIRIWVMSVEPMKDGLTNMRKIKHFSAVRFRSHEIEKKEKKNGWHNGCPIFFCSFTMTCKFAFALSLFLHSYDTYYFVHGVNCELESKLYHY